MKEVVTAIARVTDIMGEITVASKVQSTGVARVGQAIAQIDQATQQIIIVHGAACKRRHQF